MKRVLIIEDEKDLKKAENMRRVFVANVSHELRIPASASPLRTCREFRASLPCR